MRKHIQAFHVGLKFPCDYCSKVFNHMVSKKHHIARIHDNIRIKCECKLCGREFGGRSDLRKHLKYVHLTAPDYECDTCGKKFKCKISRDKHIANVHKSMKNHECNICHMKFFTKSFLMISQISLSIDVRHKTRSSGDKLLNLQK